MPRRKAKGKERAVTELSYLTEEVPFTEVDGIVTSSGVFAAASLKATIGSVNSSISMLRDKLRDRNKQLSTLKVSDGKASRNKLREVNCYEKLDALLFNDHDVDVLTRITLQRVLVVHLCTLISGHPVASGTLADTAASAEREAVSAGLVVGASAAVVDTAGSTTSKEPAGGEDDDSEKDGCDDSDKGAPLVPYTGADTWKNGQSLVGALGVLIKSSTVSNGNTLSESPASANSQSARNVRIEHEGFTFKDLQDAVSEKNESTIVNAISTISACQDNFELLSNLLVCDVMQESFIVRRRLILIIVLMRSQADYFLLTPPPHLAPSHYTQK